MPPLLLFHVEAGVNFQNIVQITPCALELPVIYGLRSLLLMVPLQDPVPNSPSNLPPSTVPLTQSGPVFMMFLHCFFLAPLNRWFSLIFFRYPLKCQFMREAFVNHLYIKLEMRSLGRLICMLISVLLCLIILLSIYFLTEKRRDPPNGKLFDNYY